MREGTGEQGVRILWYHCPPTQVRWSASARGRCIRRLGGGGNRGETVPQLGWAVIWSPRGLAPAWAGAPAGPRPADATPPLLGGEGARPPGCHHSWGRHAARIPLVTQWRSRLGRGAPRGASHSFTRPALHPSTAPRAIVDGLSVPPPFPSHRPSHMFHNWPCAALRIPLSRSIVYSTTRRSVRWPVIMSWKRGDPCDGKKHRLNAMPSSLRSPSCELPARQSRAPCK